MSSASGTGKGVDPPNADPIRILEERLGAEFLRKRLAREADMQAGCSHQNWGFLHLNRFVRIDPMIEIVCRIFGLYAWGYRNFRDIRRVERDWFHPALPEAFEGFRILQVSDLHLDLDETLGDGVREALRSVACDLTVVTGDFRNRTSHDHGSSVRETVRLLDAIPSPRYAVLGNHDFIEIVPPLEQAGLPFLVNEAVKIEKGGQALYLGGVDDASFYRTHDLVRVRKAVPENGFSVLLSHTPSVWRQARRLGFDLMLAGHTHGGQICLPGGVPLIRVSGLPKGAMNGPWEAGNLRGYTSPGTGSCGVPLRFFCPPEITIHTLRRSPR
jgi:predicted MPP superfamily phosphohydrolase